MHFLLLINLLINAQLSEGDSLFFWQAVWQQVNENYVEIQPIPYNQAQKIWQQIKSEVAQKASEPTQKDSILYAHIKKMIYDLPDDYSRFLPPNFYKSLLPREGPEAKKDTINAGLTMKVVNQKLMVVRVVPSSPAESLGIQVGDEVLKVNQYRFSDGISLRRIEEFLWIPEGDYLVLIIKRQGLVLPKVFVIRYRTYRSDSNMDYEMLDGQILYLKVWHFFRQDFGSEMRKVDSLNPKGIIIDLRDNVGGYVGGADNFLGYWFNQGDSVCVLKERGINYTLKISNNDPIFQNIPTVILVNNKTASAAEIAASAFQDYRRAILIGEKTFGKGTSYKTIDLPRGAALLITAAYWFTPLGRKLDKIGLQPDIFIKADTDDLISGRGAQFQKALEILREKIK